MPSTPQSTQRPNLEIFDRIGGDSFASGLIHALIAGSDIGRAVEYGVRTAPSP